MRTNQGELKIVPVGGAKGIRLPKWLMEECNFSGVVKFTITKEGDLLLQHGEEVEYEDPFQEWAEEVERQGGLKDYEIIPDVPNQRLLEDWEWPEEDYDREDPIIINIVEDELE